MPAPTIELLLAYETAVESAWVSILNAAGLQAHQEFSDISKETPFVDVMLTAAMPTGQRYIVGGKQYFNAWSGNMVSRVVTQRGRNSDRHVELLGRVRMQAQNFDSLFTPANLPWHSVNLMQEIGTIQRGVDPERLTDFSELHHRIDFNVLATAWPTFS